MFEAEPVEKIKRKCKEARLGGYFLAERLDARLGGPVSALENERKLRCAMKRLLHLYNQLREAVLHCHVCQPVGASAKSAHSSWGEDEHFISDADLQF